MSPNHVPACPLPFRAEGRAIKYVDHGAWHTIARCDNKKFTADANTANPVYLARAANAYPELVAALRELMLRCDGPEGVREDGSNIQTIAASALLQKLGEE